MLQVSTEVQSSLALFDRIFEYLDLQHEITDAPDAEPLVNTRGAVELDHVRFHYDASEDPRRGSSSTIASGRWTTCRSDRARSARRARRAERRRQDHDHLPGAAHVRRRRGRGAHRRSRRAIDHARIDRRCDRHRDAGDLPVPRHDPPQPALRAARRDPGGARGGGARGQHPRPDRRAARGLRHRRGRARLQALGRREAAARDRARDPEGPEDPHPGRGDVVARHDVASGWCRRRWSR